MKLFDGPVNFVPVQSEFPTFKLALRHVVPRDQIPRGIDPDTTEQFSIEYEDDDLEYAVRGTEENKRFPEEFEDVPAQSNKRNRSG
jgi:hypothetical protein